jgi:DDE family transposase
MLERVREHCGRLPERLTADTGYLSQRNITYCKANGVDVYIALRRKDNDASELGRLPMSEAQEVRWRMHQKVTSAAGRAIYARRKVTVEPVFGQIKGAPWALTDSRYGGCARSPRSGKSFVCATTCSSYTEPLGRSVP